ncbi:MAG: polyamine aminopropyltransferase [Pikeienuella sp.]
MSEAGARRGTDLWLLAATFVIAVAGMVYELIAATASSYLVGDSVTQFSLVIGVFLSSMGLGAWLSRFAKLAERAFVSAQIALGVLGGASAPLMFLAYAYTGEVQMVMFTLLIAIGTLVGMEVPLIARLLEAAGAKHRFENVLTVDYLGALGAALLFPLVIVPMVGLMTASLLFGALNLGVAALSVWLFRGVGLTAHAIVIAVALVVTGGALWKAEDTASALSASLYEDEIILSEDTPYQRVVLTRFHDRTRLFLNGAIQFDSLDEHRYHEGLVHPAMSAAARPANILILGGGDGMATREVLRHPGVQSVTLVDLDPRVTELFRDNVDLAALNDGALRDERVRIVNRDAWAFVNEDAGLYDVIIADLPDPRSPALSKLYSKEFYAALSRRLRSGGAFVTQAGSPVFARQAFWSVAATAEAGFSATITPYHVYVPSFGDWGFVLAAGRDLPSLKAPDDLRYLNDATWQAAQVFGNDASQVEAEVNTIRDHPLIRYYQDGWSHWFR